MLLPHFIFTFMLPLHFTVYLYVTSSPFTFVTASLLTFVLPLHFLHLGYHFIFTLMLPLHVLPLCYHFISLFTFTVPLHFTIYLYITTSLLTFIYLYVTTSLFYLYVTTLLHYLPLCYHFTSLTRPSCTGRYAGVCYRCPENVLCILASCCVYTVDTTPNISVRYEICGHYGTSPVHNVFR